MLLGADYLGGKHFEKEMLKTHPQGWCAGIFLRTFGDATKTLERMTKSGRFSEIVVHLAEFDRSHQYQIQANLPQVLRDAKFCQALQQSSPHTKILISPFCEHNHKATTMKQVFDKLRAVAPNCIMVNSIWKGEVIPGIITEVHLENSKPKKKPPGEYIVSFDGFGGDGSGDFTDADVPGIIARYPDARQIRLWNFRYNGKFGHKDTTPVNKRKHWPSEKYLRGHNAMMKQREGGITWSKDKLMKAMGDDHGSPPPTKDNKLMCILPWKADKALALDSQDNQIDVLRRMTPDHAGTPKGARYYSTLYAYEVANKAEKNTGSRLIKFKIGSKITPLTDGDLRSNLFR